MFSEETKALTCPHGQFCIKWGCGRQHPKGRVVGFDCPHDLKCWGKGCELHHSQEHKNSELQKAKIKGVVNHLYQQQGRGTKYSYRFTKPCHYIYEDLCPHGDKCWFKHKKREEPKEEPKKEAKKEPRKTTTCSMCQQVGHNKRTCWMKTLPPPPDWL